MHRKTPFAVLLVVSIAVVTTGCAAPQGTPQTTPPAECPVDTLDGYEPPNDLSRDAVTSFVQEYEIASLNRSIASRERVDRVQGPVAQIHNSSIVDGGYLVYTAGYAATYSIEPELAFEYTREPVEGAVSFNHTRYDRLHDLLDAVYRGERSHLSNSSGEYDFQHIRDTIEALAGEVDGAAFELTHATVLVSTDESVGHADYWTRAAYYVTSDVVYRTDNLSVDPRNGELLECN